MLTWLDSLVHCPFRKPPYRHLGGVYKIIVNLYYLNMLHYCNPLMKENSWRNLQNVEGVEGVKLCKAYVKCFFGYAII